MKVNLTKIIIFQQTDINFFSYRTVIAERVISDDKTVIIKNVTRYSNTTSKHQALLDKYDYIVTDVPKGETNLIKYM